MTGSPRNENSVVRLNTRVLVLFDFSMVFVKQFENQASKIVRPFARDDIFGKGTGPTSGTDAA